MEAKSLQQPNNMLGIDIVYIPRLKDKPLLIDAILSSEEKKLFLKAPKKEEFLAGRFAAKEAFLKAHHFGLKDIPLKEIKVLYNLKGAPIILYKERKYDVSISHDQDYAIAIVNI